MGNFVLTITFLLVGTAMRRFPVFPDRTGNVLNFLVMNISLPALVLLKIPELVISDQVWVPALMPWVMLLFSAGAILLLSTIFRWNRETTGCLLLMIPLGNTSFLGIPMVKAFFGDEGIPYALVYDQLGSFPALVIYGSVILAMYGSGEHRPTVSGVLKKLVSFPPFMAFLLAVLLRGVPYPPVAVGLFTILAATVVPLVMIAVGFQLSFRLTGELTSQLGIGLSLKMVVVPMAAFLLCELAGLRGDAVRVSIFEAGMPPMVLAGALAISDNLSPVLTAALVGIGIILSFATLPILYQIIR